MFDFLKRKKHIKSAGVYQHPDVLIIHAQVRAPAGFLVSSAPVFKLYSNATAQEIGAALRQALSQFQDRPRNPDEWMTLRSNFLKATGFRSWRRLESQAKSCWIEQEEAVVFTPFRNGGTRGAKKGFQPFGANEIEVPSDGDDAALGRALVEALSVCE